MIDFSKSEIIESAGVKSFGPVVGMCRYPGFLAHVYLGGVDKQRTYQILHSLEGPAYSNTNDGATFKAYVIFGKQISEEEFYTPGFIDAFILERS